MGLVWADKVVETTTTTGTGALTLAGALTGYRAFSAVCAIADTAYYTITAVGSGGEPTGEWEAGLGTYSSANTLTRTTVQASSNAGAAVSFGAGTKRVTLSQTASAIRAGWLLQFGPLTNEAPTANYATLDTRNNHPCLDFDTTTQEAAIWTAVLPTNYAGSGLTVSVWCSLTSATTGTVGWDVAFERMDVSTLDTDADSFGVATTITAVTVPGTSGQLLRMSVAVSSGANLDSLAAGELFRIRVRRDVANDTAAGDAELLAVTIGET